MNRIHDYSAARANVACQSILAVFSDFSDTLTSPSVSVAGALAFSSFQPFGTRARSSQGSLAMTSEVPDKVLPDHFSFVTSTIPWVTWREVLSKTG